MNKKVILLMVLLLLLAGLISILEGRNFENVIHQHEVDLTETDVENALAQDGHLNTHLPIVIVNTRGRDIPGAFAKTEKDLLCEYKVVDHASGMNSSKDAPEVSGLMQISIRGNSSRIFEKKQYAVRLVDGHGAAKDVELLGMPAESNWVLNGSLLDHSQIRNYVMYNLSAEIMGASPKCRLCEVMFTDEQGKVSYQGLYTLIEKPKVSKNRLNLTPYNAKHAESSYMIHMNTPVEEVELTHLKPDNLSVYTCELAYPKPEDVTEKTKEYIQNDLLRIEKVLFDADYTGNWEKLEQYIDLDSFVDYYIINEFFQNYDAGKRSTYLYKNLGGKLCIGPVWDFDGAFNNFYGMQFRPDILECKSTFYYYYLVQSPEFLRRLEMRYQELRSSYLSNRFLLDYIDEAFAYAEKAIMRNCDKWYKGNHAMVEQDVEKMKNFVISRGKWMDKHFIESSGLIN